MGGCVGKSQIDRELRQKALENLDQVSNTAGTNAIIIDILNQKGGRITKEYTLLNPPIGKGSTSEVRKAIHRKSGQMRAVKIIPSNPSKEVQTKIKLEVELLQILDHPNILKIQESYQDDRFFYIVTELCSGGELFQKIEQNKKFSEAEAAKIIKQLLRAVYYSHQVGIVHRDIRPENILFESDREDAQIRLVDFGSATFMNSELKLSGAVGQAYYMSPEMYGKRYDEKCDVWACGIILYILLCGYPPFLGKNDDQIRKKVCTGVFQFDGEDWSTISNEAKEMIRKMLMLDVNKRYTAFDALTDDWIKDKTNTIEVEENQLRRVFSNMMSYNTSVKLQEVSLAMIVFFLASKEEKQELMQIFQTLDLNNDGRLSLEELKQGMMKVLTTEESETHSFRIIQNVDKKQLGSIDYSTFLVISIDRQNLLTKNRMETAFKMIDRNGSGGIAVDELKETFKCNKDYDDVWKSIINEVDRNQDGQISLTEFKEMLLKLTK